jgi:hypothetical protein
MAAATTVYDTKLSKDALKALMRSKNVSFLSSDNKQALIHKCLAGGVNIPDLTTASTAVQQSVTVNNHVGINNGASPASSRSFLGILELIRSKSIITQPKEVALDRTSEIIEYSDFLIAALGDYRDDVKPLYQKATRLIKLGKDTYGNNVPPIAILFGYLSNNLHRTIMMNTNLGSSERSELLTAADLAFVIAGQFQCNLIAMSLLKKLQLISSDDFSDLANVQRFNKLVHALRIVPPNQLHSHNKGVFKNPLQMWQDVHKTTAAMNEDLSSVSHSPYLCIDDDHINAVGKEMDASLVPGRMDKRKGNGFTIMTSTSVPLGIVSAVMLADTVSLPPQELIDGLRLQVCDQTVTDRGITRANLSTKFAENDIGSLGILTDQLRYDHPADLCVTTFDNLDKVDLAKLRPQTVLSYGGVGMTARYWKFGDKVTAISVVNKTSKASTGHLRFLATGKLANPELAKYFVRIPAPISSKERDGTLIECAKKQDVNAASLYRSISTNLVIVTLTQGTADWYLLRRTGLTATIATFVVKPVIRQRKKEDTSKWKLISSILWKDHIEESKDNLDEEAPVTVTTTTASVAPESTHTELPTNIAAVIVTAELAQPSSSSEISNEEDDSLIQSDLPDQDFVLHDNMASSLPDGYEDRFHNEVESHNNVAAAVNASTTEHNLAQSSSLPEASQAAMMEITEVLQVQPVPPSTSSVLQTTSTDIQNIPHSTSVPISHPNLNMNAPPTTGLTTLPTALSVSVDPLLEIQCKLFERICTRNFVTRYKGSEDTKIGHLMEPRAIVFLEENLPFIHSRKIYTVGLARSKHVPHLYDSKDGVFQINLKEIPGIDAIINKRPEIAIQINQNPVVPCGLEIKTSKTYTADVERAIKRVDIVIAGSAEYHGIEELKLEFKSQMLHQSANGHFNWNMLSAWTAAAASRTVLIYYPPEAINEYEEIVRDPIIAGFYDWFQTGAIEKSSSDEDLKKKIPKFASTRARRLWESHVPLLRAVYACALSNVENTPFEPTHTFRTSVIALYDHLKGATDIECRAIADAWKAMSQKLSATNKLCWRLLYTAAVIAVKLMNIINRVEKIGGIEKLPKSLHTFRHQVNRNNPVNDGLWDLAIAIRNCGLPFGSMNAGQFQITQIPATPRNPYLDGPVLAADPEQMMRLLQQRAIEAGRTIDKLDFLFDTKIPAASELRSPSTPGTWIFKDSYQDTCKRLVGIFAKRPKVQSVRSVRVAFWNTEGLALRLNPVIFHRIVESETRRPCFRCMTRSRNPMLCVFCGESFCGAVCVDLFHKGSIEFNEAKDQAENTDEADSTMEIAATEAGSTRRAIDFTSTTYTTTSVKTKRVQFVVDSTPATLSKRKRSNNKTKEDNEDDDADLD